MLKKLIVFIYCILGLLYTKAKQRKIFINKGVKREGGGGEDVPIAGEKVL